MDTQSSYSVAVFAHNVAGTIIACLESVTQQDSKSIYRIFVLINGSKDATEKVVQDYAAVNPKVTSIRLSKADKANAWNYYIHKIRTKCDVHFFVDGDVRVAPSSFGALSTELRNIPEANAVGALPLTGRDRLGWTKRMLKFGRLAKGLYALTGSFVSVLALMAAGLLGFGVTRGKSG